MLPDIPKLASVVKFDDVLDVIKEEAAELIQAASKVQRAHSATNPTEVSIDDAYKNLCEEYTDLCLAVSVLNEVNVRNGEPKEFAVYFKRWIAKRKARRWLRRIGEAET